MAEFYPAVTTDLGITLAADLLVGEQMVFTKLVAGSGIYTEDETVRTNLQKAEALREPRQEFAFSSIKKETDACVLLKTLLSNISLTEGYRMTEIGVYAKRIGEEGDGILYSLSVAKEADYFPRYNGMAAVEIIEEYYITVSDAAEVTIETGRSAAVLFEDFEKFQEEMQNRLDKMKIEIETAVNNKIAELQRKIGDLSALRTEKKCCLVDAINEIAEVIRPLIEYSLATNQDIDDIIAEVYTDDVDWITMLDIASDRDIELIISGMYEDSAEDETDAATDQDIDDIIAGAYVDEEEGEMEDVAEKEIEEIVENAF